METLGIRVFTFQENPLATVRNILETALLFVPDQTRGKCGTKGDERELSGAIGKNSLPNCRVQDLNIVTTNLSPGFDMSNSR